MEDTRGELVFAVMPQIWLALGALVCSVFSVVTRRPSARQGKAVAVAAFLLAIASALLEVLKKKPQGPGVFLEVGLGRSHLLPGTLIVDNLAVVGDVLFCVLGLVTCLLLSPSRLGWHRRGS